MPFPDGCRGTSRNTVRQKRSLIRLVYAARCHAQRTQHLGLWYAGKPCQRPFPKRTVHYAKNRVVFSLETPEVSP